MAATGYHFSAKVISRGAGQGAIASAAYRTGERLVDERTGEVKDYSRKHGVEFVSHACPEDAPAWAQDIGQAWNMKERAEDRSKRPATAQLARDYTLSFPCQLDVQQRAWMLKDFQREAYTRKGKLSTAAIHEPHRGGDGRNFHAHIMVADRLINAEGFSPTKDRQWTTRGEQAAHEAKALLHMKERWAELGARQLERAGFKVEAERWRHGHKTLAAQRSAALARGDTEFAAACAREPGKHLGVTATAMERKGIKTDRGDQLRAVEQRNRERAGLEKELNEVTKQINLESERKTTPAFAGAGSDELGAAEKAMHSLGDALGGAAKTVGKVFEAVTRGGRTEPWMKGRGGVDGLNAAQRHSAALSYEKWKARKPELAGRHDFADYVQYVQEQWARGHYVESGDREIHRDATTTAGHAADKLVSTAERTVDKAAHAGGVLLGGLRKGVEGVIGALGDLFPTKPPEPEEAKRIEQQQTENAEAHDFEAARQDKDAAQDDLLASQGKQQQEKDLRLSWLTGSATREANLGRDENERKDEDEQRRQRDRER